jgi:23S rRNA (cytidine1920-2'-O)/16S rRNA (cytidine1409-2'-O)-methyltransferase
MPSRKVPLLELLKATFPAKPETELRGLIMRGDVRVNGDPVEKPGTRVDEGSRVSLREARPYVSRGGEKLAWALGRWRIDCRGAVWLDAGCSTGGFTDCLLAHGASRVYAVDVGVNQLDWRLRDDARVTVLEGTNVMHLRPGQLDPAPRRAAADLSFRSLRRAASHVLSLTTEERGVFLVKPQFEWARPSGEFRGVVRDPQTVVAIVAELLEALASEDVRAEKALLSPIHGRKGNREILFLLSRGSARPGDVTEDSLRDLIREGWSSE